MLLENNQLDTTLVFFITNCSNRLW